MEFFEVHITGDNSIHDIGQILCQKTIGIDLLRADKSVLREEHMTSLIYKYEQPNSYDICLRLVGQLAAIYVKNGVYVQRIKIECPYYQHYVDQSLYMESHFESDDFELPTSRNQRKTTFLATDRTYDKSEYQEFAEKYKGKELELCLYDTFVKEDKDWFDEYSK
jgi:hypothetical protein